MPTTSQPRSLRRLLPVAFAAAVIAPIAAAATTSAGRPGPAAVAGAGAPERAVGKALAPEFRDALLRPRWRSSRDVAVTGVGDATAFHVMVSRERAGYRWQTLASLSEPGLETDRWIGNLCVSSSGRTAVAVYGPRQFTNKGDLFSRGGFAALVDLSTGRVRKIPVRSTLAYYNPGCGAADAVSLSQFTGDDGPVDQPAKTRLFRVDARTGKVSRPVTLNGQITSAVPIAGGRFVAAGRRSLITVEARGRIRRLAAAVSTPFRVAVDGAGGVVFMEHAAGVARVGRVPTTRRPARTVELARGPLTAISAQQGTRGRVWIVGRASTRALPKGVRHLRVPSVAQVSSEGHMAVSPATVDAAGNRPGEHPQIALRAQLVATGTHVVFNTRTGGAVSAAGAASNPLLQPELAAAAVGSPTNPVDADATCSVPRNDATLQVYQPTPRQVEWAADQAVVGNLTFTRPANWKKSGLAAWSPQGLFPRRTMLGGGRVPVQVLLGILAQESNLWQASGHALPGLTGNPLVGNFYGRGSTAPDGTQDWNIVWGNADCGYGVSQRTDGMRKSGFARPGEVLLPLASQKAVALDYATNIASGLQLLQDKWNETRAAGLIHSNGDPKWLENWIFAIWAYNSGFHPNLANGTPWGVGWLNNPANPNYPANRTFFAKSPFDATHPQDWPYTEKVIGFAAYSIGTPDGPGFRPAWWVGTADRERAKPEIYTFCTAANTCTPGASFTPNAPEVAGEPAGPCAHKNASGQYDLKCYWHTPTEFNNCGGGLCGNELLRFDTTYPEQPDGTNNPPNCALTGLPTGSLIVDDVPDAVPPVTAPCSHVWTSQGTFGLTFASDVSGLFPSKVDFHQIGGGFGGHFWFAHTRLPGAEAGKLKVTGTWTLNQPITGWARVFVHMPDHGAHTQQAAYVVSLGNGTQKKRYALQRIGSHKWVSLGVMQFSGTPSITLSSETFDGAGRDDIAWDAVAFQKLPAKPKHFVVALGDSYSSGEGASDPVGGDDYYPESDNNGALDDDKGRNACHRSPFAWSRKAFLNDVPAQTIGQRADLLDNTIDFQFHACSGARTFNVIPFRSVGTPKPTALGKQGVGQYGEVSQLDKGYLDGNTTLVTISIGGNDARFSDVVKQCIYGTAQVCQNSTLSGDTQPMTIAVPAQMNSAVKAAIGTTLAEIHKKAPNAKIVLMGYPKLFENTGQCIPGIGTEEAPWLNQMGDTMATMMGQAAADATALGTITRFANPIAQFAGKGICGSPVEAVHGIVNQITAGDKPQTFGIVPPSAQSFHPKINGTTLYANTLNAALRAMGL